MSTCKCRVQTVGERKHHAGLIGSVIVPLSASGSSAIARCLDGLASQSLPAESYEVLLVDTGVSQEMQACIQDWCAHHPDLRIRFLTSPGPLPATARNYGAQAAAGEILLFTDADCVPSHRWVEQLIAAFDDDRVVGAKGTFRTEQTGIVPRFVQAEYEDRYDRMRRLDQIDFIDNYAAAYRRDVFLANEGFDALILSGEDQELSFRLAEKGYRMVFVPAAVVTHVTVTSLKEYVRRKFAMGYWKALLTRLHPERMVEDTHTPQVLKLQIVLAGGILVLLGPALLALLWASFAWLWLLVALLSGTFLVSATPFLVKLARRSWALTLFGPALLGVRAATLGVGYVAGTVQFAGTLPGVRRPVIPGWKRFAKRAIDIVGALIGLAIAIPLVAIAATAIKLDSPGPVFYFQVRIGENGRPFSIVKLRSMVVDADRRLDQLVDMDRLADEPAFKIVNDPRVTRVGYFLRRTSLDELPQFFNVLKGDMSLVGPRPEEERVVRLYTDYHRRRLAVKPGLTGPMQVSGRGDLGFSERLQLELDYIEHFSLRRDFAIMLRTLPMIFHGTGAH